MSDYSKELDKKEELAKLRVELRDKSLEKYFDIREKEKGIEDIGYDEKQIKKEVKRFVDSSMKDRKLKLKKLKTIALATSLVAAGIGTYVHYKVVYTPEVEAAIVLENEIGIHGGLKDINSDKYIYNLPEHLENGECAIEEELPMEERISNFCDENNLSNEVKQAALQKYDLYYHNQYKEGNKIDLSKMVKTEQKQERKNKNKKNKDLKNLKFEIEIHGGKKDKDYEYIYDLAKHIESGKCLIPKEGDLSISERIEKYCNEKGFSDAIADAAIAKFNCYYSGQYDKGDDIDLNQLYNSEKSNDKNEENSLEM